MMITNWLRFGAAAIAASFTIVISAGVAPAQSRGMMMPMQSMMMQSMPMQPMMNMSRPMANPQVTAVLRLLRQREVALDQALRQVQAQSNALAMSRPTMARNATIMALQREEAILMLAIRQTATQITAFGG